METKQNQIIKTVLIVEDDRVCQHIAKAYLSSLGYEVEAVDDATTAINRLKEKAYHLIFTDFRLPDEPGTAVIQAARECEINRFTPIILVSAQINKDEFETYRNLGADAVIIKPYSAQVLEETIEDCHLTPYYQRKFFYQVKACINAFEENIKQPQTQKEFELWMDRFLKLLEQSTQVLREYRQWYELEKLKQEEKS